MDNVNKELICKSLYKLANLYIKRFNLNSISDEDYIQELVSYVWVRIDKYDPEKSKFGKWVFMWFDSWRSNYLKKQKNSIKIIESLDSNVNDEDDVSKTELVEDKSWDDTLDSLVFREMYDDCNVSTKLWLSGLNYTEIAQILGCDRSTVYRSVKNNIYDLKEKYANGKQ